MAHLPGRVQLIAELTFRAEIRNTKLAAIKNLWQIGFVGEYEEQFITLVCRCKGLREANQVELWRVSQVNPDQRQAHVFGDTRGS